MHNNSNVTELFPGRPRQLPVLRKVDWLADLLGMSKKQTYDAINSHQVPPDCIRRVGRRIRVIEERAVAWVMSGGDSEAATS